MMMEMEDLLNRMRDINSMKVTREIQLVRLHYLFILPYRVVAGSQN